MKQGVPFQSIGEFQPVSIIQDGLYSLALKAYQPRLKRLVFIKLLKPQVKNHRLWIDRFTREAQVCARLKHPHIVDVYTIGEIKDYTYMAMEYVAGLSLKELLDKEEGLTPGVSLEIVRQLLLALEFAHRNTIIHRDVKPGNILIDIHGWVKLTDFGLAYLSEDATLTQQGSILGTPAYLSPEQITGEPLTPASDFFAVGAMLYEMLSGIKPFAGDNYSACIQKILNEDPAPMPEFNPDISSELNNFVFWLINKNPGKRPVDGSEIIDRLQRLEFYSAAKNTDSEISQLVQKYYTIDKTEQHQYNDVPNYIAGKKAPEKLKSGKKGFPLILAGIILILALLIIIWQMSGNRAEKLRQDLQLTEQGQFFNSSDTISRNSLSGDAEKEMTNPADFNQSAKKAKSVKKQNKTGSSTPKVTDAEKFESESERKTSPSSGATPEEFSAKKEKTPDGGSTAINVIFIEMEIIPWGAVSLDGKLIDSLVSRKKITVSPGNHRLVLSHPEFPPKVFEFTSEAGATEKIRYSFLENAGYLAIEVRPWAEVHIDGKLVDTTPLERLITLSAGEHLLELKHPDYPIARQLIRIQAGDTLKVQKVLTQ